MHTFFFFKCSLFFFKLILMIVCLLVSFSFLTLYERKIIATSQIRSSPQNNLLNGVIQPFLDALKLLTKGFILNEEKFFFNKYLMFFSIMLMMMYFHFWMVLFMIKGESFNSSNSMICFLALLSISLYSLIFLSFFSLSKYPFFSLLRAISQSISYEINFSMIILLLMVMLKTLNLSKMIFLENFFFLHLLVAFLMVLVSIIESFRSPYDFSESESELVSGFTSELGSLKFIFIFMAEYSILLFYIVLNSMIFSLNYFFLMFLVAFIFMFSRSVLPRVRYDFLMNFCWKNIFPLIVFLMFVYLI